jgi:hypothetical protein
VPAEGSIEKQILKDVALMNANNDEVVWHFMGSSASHTVGPSAAVLRLLEKHNIKFIIHLPE